MTPLVRRAGAGLDAEGARVAWSVSEGRKGRRWREVRVAADRGVLSSLLLETDPVGRFLHTELSTAAGLLTLHPEPDGTLHGNVVADDGVRHVMGLPWSDDAVFVLEGSAIAVAAAAHRLGDAAFETGEWSVRAARVGLDLVVDVAAVDLERVEQRGWRIDGGPVVELDRDGLPALTEGSTWPLEAG